MRDSEVLHSSRVGSVNDGFESRFHRTVRFLCQLVERRIHETAHEDRRLAKRRPRRIRGLAALRHALYALEFNATAGNEASSRPAAS